MRARLLTVEPEKAHSALVRVICLQGGAEPGVVLAEIPRRDVENGLRLVQVGQGVRICPSRVEQEAALVAVQAVADRPGPGHGLGGLQLRSLAGQQADGRCGQHDQPDRRERQRGGQPPPEAHRDEDLQARESREHDEASKSHPDPAGQHRGAFRHIRLADRGTAPQGEVVRRRKQFQLHQVGCLAVHRQDIARCRAGWLICLLVKDHRLVGEPLVLPEPVQDRAHCCLVDGVTGGQFCGLQRGAVGRGTVLAVATERLLARA